VKHPLVVAAHRSKFAKVEVGVGLTVELPTRLEWSAALVVRVRPPKHQLRTGGEVELRAHVKTPVDEKVKATDG
jgi:hypothetical protein